MLNKKYRLPRFCFKKVLIQGFKKQTESFAVRYLKNYQPHCRFGVIVSTKVIKKATRRNLARRRIYEVIRTNLNRCKQPRDFVFILKKEANFGEIEEELKGVLSA